MFLRGCLLLLLVEHVCRHANELHHALHGVGHVHCLACCWMSQHHGSVALVTLVDSEVLVAATKSIRSQHHCLMEFTSQGISESISNVWWKILSPSVLGHELATGSSFEQAPYFLLQRHDCRMELVWALQATVLAILQSLDDVSHRLFRWPEHLSSVCEPQDESVVARQNSPVLGIQETPEVAHLLVFLLALGIRLSVACQGFRDGCTQLLLLLGGPRTLLHQPADLCAILECHGTLTNRSHGSLALSIQETLRLISHDRLLGLDELVELSKESSSHATAQSEL